MYCSCTDEHTTDALFAILPPNTDVQMLHSVQVQTNINLAINLLYINWR